MFAFSVPVIGVETFAACVSCAHRDLRRIAGSPRMDWSACASSYADPICTLNVTRPCCVRQFQVAILQADLRWTRLHSRAQQAEGGSANLHVLRVQLSGNLRRAGRTAHRSVERRLSLQTQRLRRAAG